MSIFRLLVFFIYNRIYSRSLRALEHVLARIYNTIYGRLNPTLISRVLPFLLYSIIMLVASIIATLPLMLGWLVLGPILVASIYTAYRDIYLDEAS